MKTTKDDSDENIERLVQAYDRLIERVTGTKSQSSETLVQALESAKEKAVHLGEVTRDEAQQVHEFVHRDLYSLGHYLATSGHEVADWLRLETLIHEKEALSRLSMLSEQLKVEYKHLKKVALKLDEWQTGETTGIGTLQCNQCDQLIHFQKTGRVPPCPRCKNNTFKRLKEKEEPLSL